MNFSSLEVGREERRGRVGKASTNTAAGRPRRPSEPRFQRLQEVRVSLRVSDFQSV